MNKAILISLLLCMSACSPLPCKKNHMRAFLDKHSTEILKLAHPTARLKEAHLLDANVLQIYYQGLLDKPESPPLITIRFKMSKDFKHIQNLAATDTGSITPFAVSDFSRVMSFLSPLLKPKDKKSIEQYSPRQMTARYLDRKWQNYQAVFPCE